jgi:hypothetical protein
MNDWKMDGPSVDVVTRLSQLGADQESWLHGQRVILEIKVCTRLALPEWTREAQLEAGNDDALVGLVVHKRHGVGDPLQRWVSMTLADLVAILTGQRVDQ